MAEHKRRGGHRRGGSTDMNDDIVKKLADKNEKMEQDMEYIKSRLDALTMLQQQQLQQQQQTQPTTTNIPSVKFEPTTARRNSFSSDQAVNPSASEMKEPKPKRGVSFKGSSIGRLNIDTSAADADDDSNKAPMRRIKFSSPSSSGRGVPLASNIETNSPQNENTTQPQTQTIDNIDNDNSSAYSSSVSSDDDEALAFSGWARVFFQARHARAATQVISGASTTTSQDTYLYITIHSTANELRISNTDDRWKPPLIDPPIQMKHFYAAKVPGSHSGAALFLKNDTRRLRKYIFRFEFINRTVHQPPSRYLQFIRSGKAAKKSMRDMFKMKQAFAQEDRKENLRADKRRAQDAFAVHLSTLDELLRESSEAADRFVECINTRNEEEEELTRTQRELSGSNDMMGDSGRKKRSKPPPPYWGSGYNRPNTHGSEDEEDVGSDNESSSDISEDEDELYYDDDNDDETTLDKVKVSTEQSLETLWNHIVK